MSTAIITGGAVRLGRAMALHLAKKGFNIALHYHSSKDMASQSIKEIREFGVKCYGYSLDFSDLDLLPDMIENIQRDFQDISLLINSASIFPHGNLTNTMTETLIKTMDVNLLAPFVLMREYKRSIGEGQIINILDQRITTNHPSQVAYSLSKVALSHLTTMAALEFGPQIRVNGIAPGLILPPEGKDRDFMKGRSQTIPLKRCGDIDSVLKGIDYLLNNSFVTGEILFIDGGESKGGCHG